MSLLLSKMSGQNCLENHAGKINWKECGTDNTITADVFCTECKAFVEVPVELAVKNDPVFAKAFHDHSTILKVQNHN